MKTFTGIDLGSTTTKAVLLDEDRDVIGRGITNSRSNYATAARVASEEARVDARFSLLRRSLNTAGNGSVEQFLADLERAFRLKQFLEHAPGAKRRSDFFRDIAGSRFHAHAEAAAKEAGVPHEVLLNAYDKSIIEVENRPPSGDLSAKFQRAVRRVLAASSGTAPVPQDRIEAALGVELEETYLVGVGPVPGEHRALSRRRAG